MFQFVLSDDEPPAVANVADWMLSADSMSDQETNPLPLKDIIACTKRRLCSRVTTDVHVKFAYKMIWYWQKKHNLFFTITAGMVLYVTEHLIGSLKWLKDNITKADRLLHDPSANRTTEAVGSIYLRMVHRVMQRTLWFGPVGLPPPRRAFQLFDYRRGKSFGCSVHKSPLARLLQHDIDNFKTVFENINKRTPTVRTGGEIVVWSFFGL